MGMIEWQDPPKARREYKRERYLEALQELAAAPGKWGKMDTFTDPGKANSSRTNLREALKAGRYPNVPEMEYRFSVVRSEMEPFTWGLFGLAKEPEPPIPLDFLH